MEPEAHTQLGAFTCGLFFMFQVAGTLAIYFKSRGHSLQRVVFWEMLYLLGISCFEFYVFFIHNFLGDQVTPITDMMQMTVVPMALFLLIRLTSLQGLHYPTVIINLSPYLLAFIAYILSLDPNIHLAILTFTCLHGIGIIVYGFFAVKSFNKELKSNFSNDDSISLRWLKLVFTNRTYLSNYLNQKLNTTFYDYVNGWRIRHSEQLLQTTDLSLDGVAELSGFNSLSSFRRNFIKIHHCTPTEYRNNKQSSLG